MYAAVDPELLRSPIVILTFLVLVAGALVAMFNLIASIWPWSKEKRPDLHKDTKETVSSNSELEGIVQALQQQMSSEFEHIELQGRFKILQHYLDSSGEQNAGLLCKAFIIAIDNSNSRDWNPSEVFMVFSAERNAQVINEQDQTKRDEKQQHSIESIQENNATEFTSYDAADDHVPPAGLGGTIERTSAVDEASNRQVGRVQTSPNGLRTV